jgi:hypothetical protein
MPIPLLMPAVALALTVTGAGRTPLDPSPVGDLAAVRCAAVLDPDLLEIDLKPNGQLKFVYPDDGVLTCNEAMVVSSHAADGPDVEATDPLIDQIVFQVAELEAAGPAGITVAPELDPCWAGLRVHRDGDTLLWEHVIGDGCAREVSLTVTSPSGPDVRLPR